MGCEKINDVSQINYDDRLQNCTDEIEHDNESHTETTETTESGNREENEKVVNSGIYPSSSLR
jgi:hypothetical protein